jgi:hypothetical protein
MAWRALGEDETHIHIISSTSDHPVSNTSSAHQREESMGRGRRWNVRSTKDKKTHRGSVTNYTFNILIFNRIRRSGSKGTSLIPVLSEAHTSSTSHHKLQTRQTLQRTPFRPFFSGSPVVWCFRCVKLCTTLPLMILASPRLASPLPVELSSRLTLILSGITLTALPSPG